MGYGERELELLYRQLVVGLLPQPTQIPPAAFPQETLQRVFLDLTQEHPFQQFGFTPDGGAQLVAGPEDAVIIQPQRIQIATPIALTKEHASTKVVSILRVVAKRLDIKTFVSGGTKVVINAPVGPGADAREFVASRLMKSNELADELGPSYFAGGVKFRSITPNRREENLLIEPFVRDEAFLFIDYDVQRIEQFDDVNVVAHWLDEAFGFLDGPVRRLLEE